MAFNQKLPMLPTAAICTILASIPDSAIQEALSAVESGHNDRALGKAQEVTRYQIKPEVWRRWHGRDPTNPVEAWRVASNELRMRLQSLQDQSWMQGKRVSPSMAYAAWNAPHALYVAQGDVSRLPTRVVRIRCERFQNLVLDLAKAREQRGATSP